MSEPLGAAAANPYIAALPRLPLRRPVDHDDLGGQAVIEGSRIWREVMQPFDFAWSMGAVLERQIAGTDFVMLGRSASRGPFEKAEWANFQALIPHLARAYRARRELEALRGLAADCMSALDHLDRGVVLLSGDGSIEFANRSAEAVFRDNDGLSAGARGLRTRRPQEDAALQRIVRRAAETGTGKNNAAVGGMTAWRPSGKTPYTLIAEPLAPGHRERLGAPSDAGAIVFIGGHGSPSPVVPRLAVVYGLTLAEAGVAAGVAAGQGLDDVARAAGVSVNTAKTHLKKVYAKVGVERASHLAARIAADIGGLSDIAVEPHPKG
jgi:DNA-binding CsgD family transcriptional regulator/PAS domain-containing protein